MFCLVTVSWPLFIPGPSGKQVFPPKVVLIATHADKASCSKNARGEYVSEQADKLLSDARSVFGADMELAETVCVMDAHLATSPDIKMLKSCMIEAKNHVTNVSLACFIRVAIIFKFSFSLT